jgi:hypothetical protein
MSTPETGMNPVELPVESVVISPATPFQQLEARVTALENAVHGLAVATVVGGESRLHHLMEWIKSRL